jgi:regulator of cell morphogenesis and NO signaling
MLNPSTKMADVLHYNVHLLSVLKRLGIKLGFGEKTISQVCALYSIDSSFFTEIVRFFVSKEQFTPNSLANFPVGTIIHYLRKTHDYYLNDRLPYIESLVDKLILLNPDRQDIVLVKKFFASYHEEFYNHILREEKSVFPYIISLEKAYEEPGDKKQYIELISNNRIVKYVEIHDNVDEKLNDVKNILIKYLPPLRNEELVHSILFELFELERDVKDHSLIEDKILFPRVKNIEDNIVNTPKNTLKL